MIKTSALAAALLTTVLLAPALSAPPADQDTCNKLAFSLAEKAAAKKLPEAEAVKVDELRVRELLRDGSRSRPIDLPGRGQFIQRIEVTYRAPVPVKIEFYGETRREARWEQLGCQRVGFLDDSDVIRVRSREGAFKAIKLQVSDSKLRLDRLRVVFSNGSSQTFDVRSVIPAGAETRPLDLDGRRRTIERVELDYLPSISLKRGANVCVLALGGDGRDGRESRDDRGGERWRRDDRR